MKLKTHNHNNSQTIRRYLKEADILNTSSEEEEDVDDDDDNGDGDEGVDDMMMMMMMVVVVVVVVVVMMTMTTMIMTLMNIEEHLNVVAKRRRKRQTKAKDWLTIVWEKRKLTSVSAKKADERNQFPRIYFKNSFFNVFFFSLVCCWLLVLLDEIVKSRVKANWLAATFGTRQYPYPYP